MSSEYDTSWDLHDSEMGTLPKNEDAFSRKYEVWQKRDWMTWLSEHLFFPFMATREEDDDISSHAVTAAKGPFRVGHSMQILGLDNEEQRRGILVQARENEELGSVPLGDLEVTLKSDKNYWPVREYAVWFANR